VVPTHPVFMEAIGLFACQCMLGKICLFGGIALS
jgi:hypothetical protein